jgi:hypothetical protein
MEFVNLKFTLVLFGSYASITPDLENVQYFVSELFKKEFVPSFFDEVSVKIATNKDLNQTTNTRRIALNKINGTWGVRLHSDRIEIEYKNLPFLSSSSANAIGLNLEEFKKEAVEILSIIEKKFTNRHNRIGIIITHQIDSKSSNLLKKSSSKKLSTLESEEIVEWSQKVLIRKKYNINDKQETVNISKDIAQGKNILVINNNQIKIEDAILTFDINTIPENKDNRFDAATVQSFLDIANTLQKQLTQELSEELQS